jgi:hypothetical protein
MRSHLLFHARLLVAKSFNYRFNSFTILDSDNNAFQYGCSMSTSELKAGKSI